MVTFDPQGASVLLADLQSSEGEAVAREMGGNTTFVAADVRIKHLVMWSLFIVRVIHAILIM